MNEIELPKSIQQAVDSYKPRLESSLRYRVHLLIRGVYDHLRDRNSPDANRFRDDILAPIAKLCMVLQAMEGGDSDPGYTSSSMRAFAEGDYLRTIEDYCPQAVTDYEYRGEYRSDRQRQQVQIMSVIRDDPYLLQHILAAKRIEDLPYGIQEHLADCGIDPDAIFLPELPATKEPEAM